MKPVLIGGGVLAGGILLTFAMTAGGCKNRSFAKKTEARQPSPATMEQKSSPDEMKSVNRRELDELLSIE